MTKKELADRLLEQNDGSPMLALKDIMRVLKIGYVKSSELTSDLIPVSGHGKRSRAKYYFVDDVADAIMRKGL